MNNIFSTDSELRHFLMPKLKIITESILEGIDEWNKKEIDRAVYDKGSPTVYERSPDFEFREKGWKNEITSETLQEIIGEFYYYPEGLTEYKHESVVSGEDMREYLAEIIYEGLAGDIFGQGFWTEKRDAWTRLIRIVGGSKMKTWINRGAKKARIKIEW